MTQYARPIADILTGNWTDEGVVDNDGLLYTSIDEASSDGDNSYINGDNSATTFVVKLGAIDDPQGNTDHIFHLLFRSSGSGGPEKIDIQLIEDYEGTPNVICTFNNQSNRSANYSDINHTLSSDEADAITDYSNLYIEVVADSIGSGEWVRITQAYLETPDAPAPEDRNINISDSPSIIEQGKMLLASFLILSTGITISEANVSARLSDLRVTTQETITLADNLGQNLGDLSINVQDPITASENCSLAVGIEANLQDSILLSEHVVNTVLILANINEAVVLTEQVSSGLSDLVLSETDAINVAESIATEVCSLKIDINLNDGISVGCNVEAVLPDNLSCEISDTTAIGESTKCQKVLCVSVWG